MAAAYAWLGGAQERPGCEPRQLLPEGGLGPLNERNGVHQSQMMLISPMEKLLETALMRPHVGWGRVSGNQQGGGNSQVDGDSDMVSACQLCRERAQQRNDDLCQHFGLEKALALMPRNSVPSHVSLVPFELLPQCWSSERVSPSKSKCGHFKEELPGALAALHLTHP